MSHMGPKADKSVALKAPLANFLNAVVALNRLILAIVIETVSCVGQAHICTMRYQERKMTRLATSTLWQPDWETENRGSADRSSQEPSEVAGDLPGLPVIRSGTLSSAGQVHDRRRPNSRTLNIEWHSSKTMSAGWKNTGGLGPGEPA
jgi:hypothetical protein